MGKKITREMTFGEFMQVAPDKVSVLGEYGLHCIGCHVAFIETIEQGARAHGLSEEQIEEMIAKLN